jgi:hypothetical protein
MVDEPSVFSANSLTMTTGAVLEAATDSHTPINGSTATWSSIIGNTFLGGSAAGQHQDTVKSHDQTVNVEKSRRTTIAEDEERNINKSRTTTVKENENLIVQLNRTVDVTETSKLTAKRVEITGHEEVMINVGGNYIIINKDGITLSVGKDKIIAMDAEGIRSSVGSDKSITIDGEGICSQVGADKCIAIDGEGITSSVNASNQIHIHPGGVDTLGKLVKIN